MADVEIMLHMTDFRSLKLGIKRMKIRMSYIGNIWFSESMGGVYNPSQCKKAMDFQQMIFKITTQRTPWPMWF